MWKVEGGGWIRLLSSQLKFTIVNQSNPFQNLNSFRLLNYIYFFVKQYFYPAMSQVHYCELQKRTRGFKNQKVDSTIRSRFHPVRR